MADSLNGKAAVTGIGETEYSRGADKSAIGLMLEASIKAIHDAGLGAFYRILEQDQAQLQPARASKRSYAEWDDDSFAEQHVRERGEGEAEVVFYLEGVHCAACLWLVERLPQVVPGVRDARLDPDE